MKTKPINLYKHEAIAAAKGELSKVFRILRPRSIAMDKILEVSVRNNFIEWGNPKDEFYTYRVCPFGVVGDRLWARESWYMHLNLHNKLIIRYPATDKAPSKTRAPSTMSRKHSRFLFSIEDISVMRIQSVTEEDAKENGAPRKAWYCPSPNEETHVDLGAPHKDNSFICYRNGFANLWDSKNGKDAWNRNDWVWALTLKDVG